MYCVRSTWLHTCGPSLVGRLWLTAKRSKQLHLRGWTFSLQLPSKSWAEPFNPLDDAFRFRHNRSNTPAIRYARESRPRFFYAYARSKDLEMKHWLKPTTVRFFLNYKRYVLIKQSHSVYNVIQSFKRAALNKLGRLRLAVYTHSKFQIQLSWWRATTATELSPRGPHISCSSPGSWTRSSLKIHVSILASFSK